MALRCIIVFVAMSFVGTWATGCLTLAASGYASDTGDPLSSPRHGAFRQGRTPIDEEEFYAIAGDDHAVAIVRAQREGLVAEQIGWQIVGYGAIPVMLAGIGGLAGGIALLDEDIDGLGAGVLVAGTLVMVASFIAIPLGFVFAEDAAEAMSDPVLPHGRALDAADRYNGWHYPPDHSR